jgi:hypothetical protein
MEEEVDPVASLCHTVVPYGGSERLNAVVGLNESTLPRRFQVVLEHVLRGMHQRMHQLGVAQDSVPT